MAIVFALSEGDVIAIDGGRILITVQKKTGRRVKFAVDADRDVSVTCVRSPPTAAQTLSGVVTPPNTRG